MTTTEATTFECVECGYVGHFDGALTDPLGRGDVCWPCAEHLDGKFFNDDRKLVRMTKDQLIEHYDEHHGNCYITARTTRASLMRSHQGSHRREWERKQNLVARKDDIAHLRGTFGCRATESAFASADDWWFLDHLRRHEEGDEIALKCSARTAP